MTLSLKIPSHQMAKMRTCLQKGGLREIGGWLVAEQLAPSDFELVGFTVDLEAGTYDRFASLLRKHDEKLDQILSENTSRSGRVDYLGEWHSHPTFQPIPSDIDVATMTKMVEDNGPSFAVLLIVRLMHSASIQATLTTFQRGLSPKQGRMTTGRQLAIDGGFLVDEPLAGQERK
ncbi:Mov34/MPN/PAD-1 family protein [Gymnodinialimonas ulvae]|uniref:Mov34/MPN/PAD-1 family protein n=1 Tax=Gymnodinialimonas ulvae TaxID=3126504 RepID=UPI00309CD48E